MATSLAAQLSQIAASSKSTLNVKAQKSAHAKSLLFEPRVAAAQSFQTVYALCYDGFEELCRLDGRFAAFGATLFSEAAQDEDRVLMTAAENAKLDEALESFLRLVGSRLRLMPAVKAIEWLVRRFRVHEFNTAMLITTFLPYHSIPAFTTLMSILPEKLPQEYKFLDPYVRSLTAPPRAAIVQHATSHSDLLSTISSYTLESCRCRKDYPALISFWGGVMAEAVNGMLDRKRSGRKSVQMENDQAVAALVVPILSECLVMKDVPGLQIASYMIVTILASKGSANDALLSAFMEQLVQGWTTDTFRTGLVSLCILAHHRSAKQLSGRVTKALVKVQNLSQILKEIGKDYRVDKLANGLALSLVSRLEKKGDVRGLPVVETLVLDNLLQEKQAKVVYKALLVAAYRIGDEIDPEGHIRHELSSVLISLSHASGDIGTTIRNTIQEVNFDIDELELKLNAAIRPKLTIEPPRDSALAAQEEAEIEAVEKAEDLETGLGRLEQLDRPTLTCLSSEPSDMLTSLRSLFITAVANESDVARFNDSPLLSRPLAHKEPFYFTFYIGIWCGPYPTLARVAALEQAKNRLKDVDCAEVDFQALIPYAVAALGDPVRKVRRAAADFLAVLRALFLMPTSGKPPRWGSDDLYEKEMMDGVSWMDFGTAGTLLNTVLLPALEECVLHEDHITATIKSALESSRSSEGGDADKKKHLSHSTRLSILTFLCSHVVHTPLLTVKFRLLQALNQIPKISSTTRTQLLLPLLRWWAVSFTADEAHQLAAREKLDEAAFDAACVDIVVPNDQAGLDLLFELVKNLSDAARSSLFQFIFARIKKMWPTMRSETRFSTAQAMLRLSQTTPTSTPGQKLVAVEAADLVRSVELTSDTLIYMLGAVQEVAKVAVESPAVKRIEAGALANDGSTVKVQNSPELGLALSKITFVLELVQESKPEKHPELLPSLFGVLAGVMHLRRVLGSELGYLKNLVLGSLLVMMPTFQNNKDLKIDTAVSNGDIVVSCIQESTSPAVINTALLLVAGLAKAAPDTILHNVMPVFTFMGHSVLRQGDDYSAHVINQTVKEVIPPLMDWFRKSRKNVVASGADIVSSFVIAYEHIPPHRKHGLFVSLVESLGPEDFLFAVLAVFVDRYNTTDDVLSFLAHITALFPAELQLRALVQLMELAGDLFKPKPGLSAVLLGKHEGGDDEPDPHKIALKQLTLVPHLLRGRRLRSEMAAMGRWRDEREAEASRVRDLYAVLLESVLAMADALGGPKKAAAAAAAATATATATATTALHNRCGEALANLLSLLPISEFIKSAEMLLDRPNAGLRERVLRALELRVDGEGRENAQSRTALLAFLPQLTAVIRESDDINYKYTAVTCVDKISDKYGKKDLDAVAAAAATIAGDDCLGQPSQRLRIMALLCLASLADVLQDGLVPVLPAAIPKALAYLRDSVAVVGAAADPRDVALHNAAFAFLSAIAQHLPYMLSGAYLDQLLAGINISAAAGLRDDVTANRLQCTRLLAKLVDPKALFTAMERNWPKATAAGLPAINEYLQLLAAAIDAHPKSTIAKNVGPLSAMLFEGLDFRRQQRLKDEAQGRASARPEAVETLVYGVAMKMILKLNDAAFRPLFTRLVEWSAAAAAADSGVLRQASVFGFLAVFFDGLKSIVTSYGSYVVDAAATVLRQTAGSTSTDKQGEDADDEEGNILSSDADVRDLWCRVLRTLRSCFAHDQDGFWQAPAHFSAIAPLLVAQFGPATASSSSSSSSGGPDIDPSADLIPAVVELAVAADSREHHKELNAALLKLLRSGRAATRLAGVRCQRALAARLGEDWLQALPEMLPYMSELQDDEDEEVERENRGWVVAVEEVLGEGLDSMLQ